MIDPLNFYARLIILYRISTKILYIGFTVTVDGVGVCRNLVPRTDELRAELSFAVFTAL